ncbi:tyrosinase family oxidase copper chaperone [Streptomyces sp. NPDC001595]|uniref:tyrosinase family oxidase copper chaperone n=1 Tax=Streptomyces sp. NPDC001532 TaxID=3154520 RepID=UPI003332FE37
MVVSVGGVAVGTESGPAREAAGPPGRRAAGGTRRDLVRGLVASAGALAVAPLVVASGPARPEQAPGDLAFDEIYQGRRIEGMLLTAGRALGADAEWQVTVDGRPLHLMRRADGTWLSMVDHYRSYPTPLEAARAAVDELGPGQRLAEARPAHGPHGAHGAHEGGHHGVHP